MGFREGCELPQRGLGGAPAEYSSFKVKNLASGKNNSSDVHEELYWLLRCLWQNIPLKMFSGAFAQTILFRRPSVMDIFTGAISIENKKKLNQKS